MFDITSIARPNILTLEPYRCARDDFQEGILLDANENTYGPSFTEFSVREKELELNRYPDPHQIPLKKRLCGFRNSEACNPQSIIKPEIGRDVKAELLTPANVCLSVGSDGGIDLLIRCFCKPGVEKVLVCPPTYPMYDTCCAVNDVEMMVEPLDLNTFQIKPDRIISRLKDDPSIKLVFITSPGNPTATMIKHDLIFQVIDAVEKMSWNGLIVVDEAYIDFCPIGSSMSVLVNKHKNLVVLQTFSKSFALAGIRLGVTYSTAEVSMLLNTTRDPYCLNKGASHAAMKATSKKALDLMKATCQKINEQRSLVSKAFSKIPGIGKNIGGEDANFILVQVLNKDGVPDNKMAYQLYWKLATERKVVVRYRGEELACTGCLRVTIGTPEENVKLLEDLESVLREGF
ncbi:hypothetical protein FOA43_002460 [Brettanomyces nanus]|uniref:histidinol-phosphate transaminase n=1 Tax=Eeniella nana TaxID=13502 RepID=A0A875RV02_EENNA|nr:uncharacterized protein FOA43_002460 [Brettanomyces nanus]QPG75117.1 hypothetical protein FOA43_002460 [Brettanomyces nanus]